MSMTKRDSFCLTGAGIAEGTNANTFKTTNAISAEVEGRAVVKAATDNIAFAAFTGTTFTSLAAKQTAAFFHMMNAAGAVTQLQAAVKPSPAGTGYLAGAFEWPARDGYACIGATVVRTDNSAVFVPGTTDLGATDVVDTHYDATPGVYGKPITY